MSKRSLTDDKLESEEELTEQQLVAQAIIQSIVQNRLMNTVVDIGQLTHVFRFHPVRFLELLKVSKSLSNAIGRAVENGGAFGIWYKLCLYSFPDYIIALKAHDYSFLPKTGLLEDRQVDPEWAILPVPDIEMPGLSLLFGLDIDSDDEVYFTNSAIIQQHLQERDTDFLFTEIAQWRTRVDRSFTSLERRRQCLGDENVAEVTTYFFSLMFPMAIPPAEYCFASQIALHQLSMEFLWLLLDSNGAAERVRSRVLITWLSHVKDKTSIYSLDESIKTFADRILRFVTPDDMENYFSEPSDPPYLRCFGDGPETEPARGYDPRKTINVRLIKPGYEGEHFDLSELSDVLLACELVFLEEIGANNANGEVKTYLSEKLRRFHELRERTILCAIRYDSGEGGDLLPSHFFERDTRYTSIQATRLFETRHDWKAERETDLELYGSHDPLYWDVLLCDLKRMENLAWLESLSQAARQSLMKNDQRAFQLYAPSNAWKQVLLDLLHVFVGQDKTSEKYQSLSSAMPTTDLRCHHCSHTTPTIAKIQAPFYAYCDKECQREACITRSLKLDQ